MAKIWTTASCKALKIRRVNGGGRGLRHESSVVPSVEFSQRTRRGRDLGQIIPEFRGKVGFCCLDSLGGRVLKLRMGIFEFSAPSLLCLHVRHRHEELAACEPVNVRADEREGRG